MSSVHRVTEAEGCTDGLTHEIDGRTHEKCRAQPLLRAPDRRATPADAVIESHHRMPKRISMAVH
jgi:hypothetical protein